MGIVMTIFKNNVKKFLVLLLAMLPCAAFADQSAPMFSFFTPFTTDYSVSALQSVFGSMGSVLPGRGNQLLGLVMGIFNACWIVAIGLGVIYLIYDSLLHSAQHGEGIVGHGGKKSVLKIIGVCFGFCLALPSSATGYSLAQNGVMWLVIQGVGVADKVYGKVYDYFMAGGVVVTMEKPKAADVDTLIAPATVMLKSQICLYKLQDIKLAEKKRQAEVAKGMDQMLPSYSYTNTIDEVGYSINADNTITMGTLNTQYVAENPASHRYNNECGTVAWQYKDKNLIGRSLGISNANPQATAQERTQTLAYIKQATVQMFNELSPVARQIAAIDPNTATNPDAATQFDQAAPIGATSLSNSGISFTTMIDPARRLSWLSRQKDLNDSMQSYYSKGWVFTPFLMTIPGLYEGEVVAIDTYAPNATPANVDSLTTITEQDRQDISTLMGHVDSDGYAKNASVELVKYYTTTSLDYDISFNTFLEQYYGDDYQNQMNSASSVVDWISKMMDVPKGAAIATEAASTILIGGMAGTIGFFNGIFQFFEGLPKTLEHAASSTWDCVSSVFSDCHYNFYMGDGIKELEIAQDQVLSVRDAVNKNIHSAVTAIDELMGSIKKDGEYAAKGGMNEQLKDLTKKIGPMGPIMAMMLTSMIGKGFDSFQHYVSLNNNAMITSIRVGGDMVESSLQAIFGAGRIMFVSSMVEGALGGMGQALSAGKTTKINTGNAMQMGGAVVGMANRGMGMIITMYITLALFFMAGGMLLFILVPLTWMLLFGSVVLRWLGMVLINIVAAPIFCFNLIRADSDGMIGKGHRFLADMMRTVITPAVLILGAIAFMVMFNLAFDFIAYMLTQLLPLIFKVKSHDYLVSVSLGAMLLVFGLLMTYVSNLLANLCTSDLVNAVGNTIDHALHEVKGAHGMNEQMAYALGNVSDHIGEAPKQLATRSPQEYKKSLSDAGKGYKDNKEKVIKGEQEEKQEAEEKAQKQRREQMAKHRRQAERMK